MILKQLFCKHIWKYEGSEKLNEYIEYAGGIIANKSVNEYASKYKCIMCQKKKIIVRTVRKDLTPEEFVEYSKYS